MSTVSRYFLTHSTTTLTGSKCMLNNCLQWYKVSLRTLTTEDSCLTQVLFHDCTNVLNGQ